MGLGPKGSSLLERLDRSPEPPQDTDWYVMEQQNRSLARKLAIMAHSTKHKTPSKPLAPIKWYSKIDGEHWWTWEGEEIESKSLVPGSCYSTAELRSKGFKIPKLPPEAKSTGRKTI